MCSLSFLFISFFFNYSCFYLLFLQIFKVLSVDFVEFWWEVKGLILKLGFKSVKSINFRSGIGEIY